MPVRISFCIISFITWLVLCLPFIPVKAQSDKDAKRRISSSYVITNATIIPYPGKILSHYDIHFEEGMIKAIGKKLKIPPKAVEIKGDSLFVYSGLIDMANTTGVIKPEIPDKPDGFDPSDPAPEIAGIHPHFQLLDHYHTGNTQDDEWRKLGFTIAQKLPGGEGMLPGSTALILYGSSMRSNVLVPQHALYAKFSTVGGVYPHTNLGIMAKWRDLVRNTQIYQEHRLIFANNPGTVRREYNEVFEALIPVLNKEIPVLFETSDELEMRRVIMLKEENNFNLILTGIKEGESLISIIKEKNLPAVLTINLPKDHYSEDEEIDSAGSDYHSRKSRSKNAYQKAVSLAAAYEKAKIPFAFTTKHLPRADLYGNLRTMINHGLTEEGALAALTINAAKMLEIEHLAGSLDEGKLANLIVTTDSLFKEDSKIAYTIVEGYVFDYTEKHKKTEKSTISTVWHYKAEIPEASAEGTWSLQHIDGQWSGTATYKHPDDQEEKTSPLTQINITEKEMDFQFTAQVRGRSFEVRVTGEISGDLFSGNMEIPDFGSFEVKAEKKETPEKK